MSVKLRNPQFEGQTKTKLGNSEVKGIVEALINDRLGVYLEEHPAEARRVIAKVVEAAAAFSEMTRPTSFCFMVAAISGCGPSSGGCSVRRRTRPASMRALGPVEATVKDGRKSSFSDSSAGSRSNRYR